MTPQQEAVLAAVAGLDEHVVVQAVAGAGKTTTAVKAAAQAKGTVGMVAFNKHVAAELQSRLGTTAKASTLHGLGYAACRAAFPDIQLDDRKAQHLLERLRPRCFYQARNGAMRPTEEGQTILQLARLAKLTLTDPSDPAALDGLVDHFGVELPAHAERPAIHQAVQGLVAESAADTGRIDFDDMLWLPVRLGLGLRPFDVLFVDEAQDLSAVQQALARKAGDRLIVIGDERQAIYGFTGSDCDALPRFAAMLEPMGGAIDRPLTVTFRCPVSHVALARQIVPRIEPAERAVPGVVGHLDPVKDLYRELMPGDLVISRVNAPLIDLAYRLVPLGVPVIVRGREIGRGLVDLVRRLRPDDPRDLGRKLREWHDRERDRLERRGASAAQLDALNDKTECLEVLASSFGTIADLLDGIDSLFVDDPEGGGRGSVVLSSVHRAKGLEADRVVVLAPEKLPLVHKDQRPWQLTQEHNLAYVAVTRARQELFFAGDLPSLFSRSDP